jgi:hypothetical protein
MEEAAAAAPPPASPPPPTPPPPSIAALLARAAPGGPREALAPADGDPAAALALAVHSLFVEAGFRPIRGPPLALPPSAAPSPSASLDSWGAVAAAAAAAKPFSSSSSSSPSSSAKAASAAYAPPAGWCRRPGAPDEWVFRYSHRAKASSFSLHLSLQRATGRMLARAAEEEVGGGGGGGGGSAAGAGAGGEPAAASSAPGGGGRALPMFALAGGASGGGGGPLVGAGGFAAAAGGRLAPGGGGGAAVGPPPSHNQHLLGLQLQGYFPLPADDMRRASDWATVLGPRADEALRMMVREHLSGPLLAQAEDAPLYDEDDDPAAGGVLMGGQARAGRLGGAGGGAWAPRVVGSVAIGVGLAAVVAGVAWAAGPQRRQRWSGAWSKRWTAAVATAGGRR